MQYKKTELLFAMKCIKKKRLVNESMLAQARAEKKVLLRNTHPFIVHLYRTFRDDAQVYLLFEYVSGGELDHYFRANNRCFGSPPLSSLSSSLLSPHAADLQTAKFYAAELVLAIEYLHENLGAAHRDIKVLPRLLFSLFLSLFLTSSTKLNNVMVNSEGHLRLCDFGFARTIESDELAYTLVGTPEYLPPEVLRGRGYSNSCDWWSLGITIYKMLNGHGPFFRSSRAEVFAAIGPLSPTLFPPHIVSVDGKFDFPAHFDPTTRDLLRGLLSPNEKKRLGAQKGAAAIRSHPWFKDIDWERVQREEVMPPFVPDAVSALYDQKDEREPPDDVPESYKKLFVDF